MSDSSATSSAYGLDHPCRALIPLNTPTSCDKPNATHRFLVGTCALRSNKLHLLEYHEGTNLLECIAVWSHDPEVVSMSSNCSADSAGTVSMFATVFSAADKVTTGNNEVKVFVLQGDDETRLAQQHHIPVHATDVKWDFSGQDEAGSLLLVGDSSLSFVPMQAATKPAQTIKIDGSQRVQCATRDVHHKDLVAVGYGPTLAVADRRSGSLTTACAKATSSGSVIRSIDYNPNVMYQLSAVGDDGMLRVWDLRKVGRNGSECLNPLFRHRVHDHAIHNVAFNPSHDQLMLTGSSDHTLKLWQWNAWASGSNTNTSSSGGALAQKQDFSSMEVTTVIEKGKIASNGLLEQLSDFNDSVYGSCWSGNSPWVYAGASYSGRILVSKVPQVVQRQIMLHGDN